MRIAFGIILTLVGLWFLWGTIRGRKPRVTLGGIVTRAHTPGDILSGIFLTLTFGGTGVSLIAGMSWWWIVLVSGIGASWGWGAFYGKWLEKSFLKGNKPLRDDDESA